MNRHGYAEYSACRKPICIVNIMLSTFAESISISRSDKRDEKYARVSLTHISPSNHTHTSGLPSVLAVVMNNLASHFCRRRNLRKTLCEVRNMFTGKVRALSTQILPNVWVCYSASENKQEDCHLHPMQFCWKLEKSLHPSVSRQIRPIRIRAGTFSAFLFLSALICA